MSRSGRAIMVRTTKNKTKSQDFFETPAWPTKILMEHELFKGSIWEPACGKGKMSKVIQSYGYKVVSSDKIDRGFGSTKDFLETTKLKADNIITNPPYNILNEFMRHALDLQPTKLALLIRTLSLETTPRYKLYQQFKPSKIIVLVNRVPFNGSEKPWGAWCLSWFIWSKKHTGPTELE